MVIANRLKGFLNEHKVAYHVLRHHETFTSPEIAQALHVPGEQLAKVVIVKSTHGQAMAVLSANPHVNLEKLARALGEQRVELASEDEFRGTFPDCELGAMPPFGNLYDIPVVVDERLAGNREVVFEAGTHHEAIKIRYDDFVRLVHPKTADIAGN